LVAVTALLVGLLVWRLMVRRRQLRDWASAPGRIESCSPGVIDDGMQTYQCLYIFSVDDARQGGFFQVFDKPGRLEAIRADLVGESVTVKYNPSDCNAVHCGREPNQELESFLRCGRRQSLGSGTTRKMLPHDIVGSDVICASETAEHAGSQIVPAG
jgi:hypothetical protein